jgi:hypothetical protein
MNDRIGSIEVHVKNVRLVVFEYSNGSADVAIQSDNDFLIKFDIADKSVEVKGLVDEANKLIAESLIDPSGSESAGRITRTLRRL